MLFRSHFLDKKVKYNSSSIFGMIYDKVKSFNAEKLQLSRKHLLDFTKDKQIKENCASLVGWYVCLILFYKT